MRNMQSIIINKTKSKGVGVFAMRNFLEGEVIVYGKMVRLLPARTMHSFQINANTHVQLDKVSRSINHSCKPNTGIRNNAFQAYDFIALKKIVKGEEITWDYETTEYISISVNKCLCGSKSCRKMLRGFAFREEELTEKYGIYIADYLKEMRYKNFLLASKIVI